MRRGSLNGGGDAASPLLPGEGLSESSGGYQTGSGVRPLASAPRRAADDDAPAALGGISILAANATSPRDVASIVNNYRKSANPTASPEDATRSWSTIDYVCCLVPAWLLCCRVYTNTPTSVHFVQDFKGHVTADTAALGAVTNLFSRDLGAVDFQSLNAQNYYARYGNIHVVFVPQLQYAKVVKDGQYVFLGAGYHVLPAMHFHVEGLVDTAQDVIHHGNTYIFNVPAGRVAVVSDTTKPREQQLEVLQSGHEERSSRTLRYTMLSVARQRMAVEEVVMTSDNYRLTIKGFISFRVEKPEVLVHEFGFSQDLQKTVDTEVKKLVEAAFNKAASAAAYRVALEHNLELQGVAPRKLPQVAGPRDAEAGEGQDFGVKSQIQHNIHEDLQAEFRARGLECLGVYFTEFSPDAATIQMLERNNTAAAAAMAAVGTMQLTQLAEAERVKGEAVRAIQAAEAAARRSELEANAAAKTRQIEAESKAQARETEARAEAAAREMLAKADAAAVELVGKARDAHPAQADREAARALVEALKGSLTIYAGAQDGPSVNDVLRRLAGTASASRPSQ